jgi:hypothetical protein
MSYQPSAALPSTTEPQAFGNDNDGYVVRRVVKADNSCLFTSLGYIMENHERTKGLAYRQVVASAIRADPGSFVLLSFRLFPTSPSRSISCFSFTMSSACFTSSRILSLFASYSSLWSSTLQNVLLMPFLMGNQTRSTQYGSVTIQLGVEQLSLLFFRITSRYAPLTIVSSSFLASHNSSSTLLTLPLPFFILVSLHTASHPSFFSLFSSVRPR